MTEKNARNDRTGVVKTPTRNDRLFSTVMLSKRSALKHLAEAKKNINNPFSRDSSVSLGMAKNKTLGMTGCEEQTKKKQRKN